jgi:hypothetical protein
VNDIAVHIDEERPEKLAVIGRKKGQTRLRQARLVNGDTAPLSRAANFMSVRPDQVEDIFYVLPRVGNDSLRKTLGRGDEVSVAERADEEQKDC